MTTHKRWADFARESPELADVGRDLLYQEFEFATAFLATVVPDQGPRIR